MKVAVVGATGLVGKTMMRILEERKFPVSEFIPVATANSAGKKVMFSGKEYTVITCEEAVALKPDIALFSAGGSTSLEWAPRFAQVGTTVIDNSSAWRMNEKCPLVVPEINADVLTKEDKIIANPNCSTIQMVMVLNPLHKKYKLKRIVVSTYQSVSGTGKKAVDQLMNERKGISGAMAYPYNIDMNVLPHVDSFLENGYTKEEMKMVNETRKIMRSDKIKVTATTVRVPVVGGHSEAVNAEFENQFELSDVRQLLSHTAGVTVIDDPAQLQYPMPTYAEGKDDVFVGRIRRDESQPQTLNLWVVSDNLRKGAATNAVQIAEYLLKQFWQH
ncbi:MAG TPA: aspartate-semialdehyde dehydrogenase [Bacteroidia bacterium]|nr:aspartate-semialdehyde dehydrogenase [Bacteroidia bacterium]OQB60078.1 MAG: Aspartate-semialdehyde dehydrogenase [Bacteroidetes bacterium ADurb.Bin141]QQR93962.1 MAG: aspartate-semialdehyde dehydrogenase [Bacteroidota bacterium]MBP7713336.1 aspartate-semialdehyde dehydrogenase [Bacteroidia bacterium]MBP8667782.1 aspartate-semialdehyde dehydrogenase [Bacteroidia bacterium]